MPTIAAPTPSAISTQAIDQTAGRQPVKQRLATVDGHAGRIRETLAKAASGERPPATPSGPHVVRIGGSTS